MVDPDYASFILSLRCRWCWWCGRGSTDRPTAWGAPWLIERAHIVASPRRCDPRAVVALCSLCHRSSHGILIAGAPRPASLDGMLWLKRKFDGPRYDREFLEANHVGRLPRAKAPPACVRAEYSSRRGAYPNE